MFPLIIFRVEVSKMILNMWWISGFLCVLLTRRLSEQVQEMIWFVFFIKVHQAFLLASLVHQWLKKKNWPVIQETQVLSLGGENPLEKEMATHSSILAWEIPWTEEPSGLQSMGSQSVGHD